MTASGSTTGSLGKTRWLLLMLLASVSIAESNASSLVIETQIGAEYDSNVSLEDITFTAQSDTALLFDLDIGYRAKASKALKLTADYGFSQSLYNEFDEFDLQSHLVSGGASYDLGETSLSAKYYWIDSLLDGEDYLEYQQFSPAISHYFSRKMFLRTYYRWSDKFFADREERNAVSDAFGGDLYFFVDGAKRYISIGYRLKVEDAEFAGFDYESDQVKLRWVNRLSVFNKRSRLRLGWSYERRDYDDPRSLDEDAEPGDPRRKDDRTKASVELEVNLSKKNTLSVEYEYSDFQSSFAVSDYSQHVIGIQFSHRF